MWTEGRGGPAFARRLAGISAMKDEALAGLIGCIGMSEVDRIGVRNDEAVAELVRVMVVGVSIKAVMMEEEMILFLNTRRDTAYKWKKKQKDENKRLHSSVKIVIRLNEIIMGYLQMQTRHTNADTVLISRCQKKKKDNTFHVG